MVEEDVRHSLESDSDLSAALGHAFGGADEKRDPRPAPVVDVHLQGDKGLGGRILGHAVGITVAGNGLAVDESCPVLAADDMVEDILASQRAKGA